MNMGLDYQQHGVRSAVSDPVQMSLFFVPDNGCQFGFWPMGEHEIETVGQVVPRADVKLHRVECEQ